MKIKNCNHILNKVICQLVLIFFISVTASANSNWESFVKDIKAKSNTNDADSKGILSSFIEMDGVGGTYNEAFDLATDSSGKNSFYGHYSLGKLLKNGRGVSQNSKKANEFFNKSVPLILKEAANGNPICQYLAAECYNYGNGVDLNPKKAENWSMKSIDRGFLASYHQLAIAYMNQEKSDEYLSNLKKSAEYGFAASQLALYSANQIFAESKSELEEAKEWFQKAIKQNCASLRKPASSEIASNSTKPIKAEEKALNQTQSSSDLNRNPNNAIESQSSNLPTSNSNSSWEIYAKELKSKVNSGDMNAQGMLSLYIQLSAILGSKADAFSLAEQSAAAASPYGLYALGRCFETGVGTAENKAKAQDLYKQAYYLIEKSADEGNLEAICVIAAAINNGRGVEKNADKAKIAAKKAADKGFAPAQDLMGFFLQTSLQRKHNEETIEWCSKSADQGYPPSQMLLGDFYSIKQGCYSLSYEPIQEAIKWYSSAAEKGFSYAQRRLGYIYSIHREWEKFTAADSTNDSINEERANKRIQELAYKWHLLAAENIFPDAQSQLWLGEYFKDKKNYSEAFKWIKLASDNGNEDAIKELAECYMEGIGVAKDRSEGMKLLNTSREKSIAEQKALVANTNKIANDVASERAKNVSDPEPEKFGGPSTLTIMKQIDGNSSNNLQNTADTISSGALMSFFGITFKDVKRGSPLTSVIGQIPAGTTIFPIRLVLESTPGSETKVDYYFYKDEFDEWHCHAKQ